MAMTGELHAKLQALLDREDARGMADLLATEGIGSRYDDRYLVDKDGDLVCLPTDRAFTLTLRTQYRDPESQVILSAEGFEQRSLGLYDSDEAAKADRDRFREFLLQGQPCVFDIRGAGDDD